MSDDWLSYANAIPGQLSDLEMRAIHDLAGKVPGGGVIVETGSLYGRSSYLWADGAGPSVAVHCFDPWQRAQWIIDYVEGPLGAPEFSLDAFKNFTADCSNIIAVPGYSPQSAEGWTAPIDLFFEDAVHEDPIFGMNCDFWLSHLKPGGYFCGHDFRLDYHDICKRVVETARQWDVPFSVADTFFWIQKPY